MPLQKQQQQQSLVYIPPTLIQVKTAQQASFVYGLTSPRLKVKWITISATKVIKTRTHDWKSRITFHLSIIRKLKLFNKIIFQGRIKSYCGHDVIMWVTFDGERYISEKLETRSYVFMNRVFRLCLSTANERSENSALSFLGRTFKFAAKKSHHPGVETERKCLI